MRFLLIFSFVALSTLSFAQGGANNNKALVDDHLYLVGHLMSIPKYHHRIELEGLKKSSLANIYIKRVRILSELMPFMAIKAGPKKTLVSLHIPESKKNLKILAQHYKAKTKHLDNMVENLRRIVNFSDKETIVEAIILLETTIWEIQKFKGGDMHHEEVH